MERYIRNKNMFTDEDMKIFQKTKVCVIGCGGLGGYIIEMLSRIGIGEISIVDGDNFCENNLNRQLISKEKNIGESKALEAKKRVEEINSNIKINALVEYIDKENVELSNGQELSIDTALLDLVTND